MFAYMFEQARLIIQFKIFQIRVLISVQNIHVYKKK